MQLSSDAQIPDGLLAAMTLLNEKPRLGFRTWENTPYPGFKPTQSTTALRDNWSVASGTWWVSLSCEFGVCGFQQGGGTAYGWTKDYLTTLWGIEYDILRHPKTPFRLFGSKWCGPGGGGDPNNHLDNACKIHDKCFDDAHINFFINFGVGSYSKEQYLEARSCNQALYDAARQYPNERGSTALQWWLINGSQHGILAPGTEATASQE